jgi:two-component system NtrC family sensor kinase
MDEEILATIRNVSTRSSVVRRLLKMFRRTAPVLRLLAGACLVVPTLLFGAAAWRSYDESVETAEQRIRLTAGLLEQEVNRVLSSSQLILRHLQETLADPSDAAVHAREESLHARLVALVAGLPEIEGIWVYDLDGHPLVSNMVYPVTRTNSVADRSFYHAHRDDDAPLFISEPMTGRAVKKPFFSFSVPWRDDGGRMRGILQSGLHPAFFSQLLDRAELGADLSSLLLRADGTVLARDSDLPEETFGPADADDFRQHVAHDPAGGNYRSISPTDGRDRHRAYRQVGDYPVYVLTGIAHSAVTAAWWSRLTGYLLFGIPATLGLFAVTMMALRRTELLDAEAARRAQAEQALHQSQKLEALGQLTGGVAHDFNNVLAIIRGQVDLLGLRNGAGYRQAIDNVIKAVDRGAGLTRHLLAFSHDQALKPKVLDLRMRLPKWKALISPSLRGDIVVTAQVAADLRRVKVDPGELELAILNVAINARDAMPTGGALEITARNLSLGRSADHPSGLRGDVVAVALRDTGNGMVPEIAARAFEPFFTTKAMGEGTGLGLSRVYGFARQSGGSATIESKPGSGTIVTLYFPATDEPLDAAAEEPLPVAAPGTARILVVEDTDEVAQVTTGLLQQFGYDVLRARDGNTAWALLGAAPEDIDLVLTDIIMPGGLTGLQLARRVRARYPALPILMVTGYSAAAQEAQREGYEILRKPFDAATLHHAIASQLAPVAQGASAPAGQPSVPELH